MTERAVWTDTLFAETTVQMHDYQTDVVPQGTAPMILLPDTTHRQLLQSTAASHQHVSADRIALHLTSGSRRVASVQGRLRPAAQPVQRHQREPAGADRAGGWHARSGSSISRGRPCRSIESTDVAVFAQDRFQPNTRWSAEFGGRIDLDGITNRLNVTPRVGAVVRLNDSGNATLRGGFGLFFERTPSTAGTFDQFENVLDTRFESDGVTPLAPPVQFVRVTSGLQTPRSQTWDIGYDHRLNKLWSLHVGGIDRRGSHELIVQALPTGGTGTGELLLSSSGNSSYREADVGINFTYGSKADFHVSYARSAALGDLNTLTNYLNAIMWPVVGANQYTTASTDIPNRLLARGRLMPTPRWLMLGIFDWRSGLPYSVVNDTLDYVGTRNSLRFPTYVRPRARASSAVSRFSSSSRGSACASGTRFSLFNCPPTSRANLASPYFGGFYNSEYRQFRIQVRFER